MTSTTDCDLRARGATTGAAIAAAAIAILFGSSESATASLPIPFAYTVCVTDGRLVSATGPFTPREWTAEPPLAALEGRTIRVTGALAPGGFWARSVTVVAQTCQPELLKAEALCDPCITTLPHVPGPLPSHQAPVPAEPKQ